MEWSRIAVLNYYSGRNFNELKEKDVEYKKYFSQKTWDGLNKEQLQFDGNILYLCIY